MEGVGGEGWREGGVKGKEGREGREGVKGGVKGGGRG